MSAKNTSDLKLKVINKHLDGLTDQLAKSNSFKHSFIRGIFAGVGTAIGASVVAVIVIAILSYVVSVAGDVPILDTVIDSSNIESALDVE